MATPLDPTAPRLAPPGRGLPLYELLVARVLVAVKQMLTTRAGADAIFARERAEIIRLARSVDDASGSRRVLIRRLRGLEDSSRFWSLYMAVDHLRIVNAGVTEFIGQLTRGELPTQIVRTAEVKPSPEANRNVIEEFDRVCGQFAAVCAAVPNLHTNVRWSHPWFGPLDSHQWHFFTGFHMTLHRRQMESILRGLPTSR